VQVDMSGSTTDKRQCVRPRVEVGELEEEAGVKLIGSEWQ
jgi:hypothetical protein